MFCYIFGFTIKGTIVHVDVYILRLSHLMSQLISPYVLCMILAKFMELRTHLLIFDYYQFSFSDFYRGRKLASLD